MRNGSGESGSVRKASEPTRAALVASKAKTAVATFWMAMKIPVVRSWRELDDADGNGGAVCVWLPLTASVVKATGDV